MARRWCRCGAGATSTGQAAQLGLELLLDAREIAVQVEEQPAQRARGQEGESSGTKWNVS